MDFSTVSLEINGPHQRRQQGKMTRASPGSCHLKSLVVKKHWESYETGKFSAALHVKHVLIPERPADLPTPS